MSLIYKNKTQPASSKIISQPYLHYKNEGQLMPCRLNCVWVQTTLFTNWQYCSESCVNS